LLIQPDASALSWTAAEVMNVMNCDEFPVIGT
jgi:hypothetical protein